MIRAAGTKKTGYHNKYKKKITRCSQIGIVMTCGKKTSDSRKHLKQVKPFTFIS